MKTHQLTFLGCALARLRFARRFLITAGFIAGAILTMVSYSTAQKVSESELQFREALHKQQVEGDLPAAIKLYQNIAASKIADRAVKARALLQLAECYEKLGQQSERVWPDAGTADAMTKKKRSGYTPLLLRKTLNGLLASEACD